MKVLCFDIGGTKIHAAVADAKGRWLADMRVPTPTQSWAAGKKRLIQIAKEFKEDYPDIKACGIACAGPLDSYEGVLLNPTNLNWGRAKIKKELSQALRMPVALENDAACAALGEYWGAHLRQAKNLIVVTLGTGVGVGVILNKQLFREGNRLHPELGHQILSPLSPEIQCACGVPGCTEGILAGSHFLERMQRLLKQPELTMEEVMHLASVRNPVVTRQFQTYSVRLAQFLYNQTITFAPERIVLSGSFSRASSYFLKSARDQVKKWIQTRKAQKMPLIEVSKLRNPSLWGAADLALSLKK